VPDNSRFFAEIDSLKVLKNLKNFCGDSGNIEKVAAAAKDDAKLAAELNEKATNLEAAAAANPADIVASAAAVEARNELAAASVSLIFV
jgi:hypothetical protein